MKISKSQNEEIDFLTKRWCKDILVTQQMKEEYINRTVLGKKVGGSGYGNSDNPLLNGKRSLDVMIKMWRSDLLEGLVRVKELRDDFNHPYFDKVIDTMVKNLDWSKRGEFLRLKAPPSKWLVFTETISIYWRFMSYKIRDLIK